jgi:hypothetical protein
MAINSRMRWAMNSRSGVMSAVLIDSNFGDESVNDTTNHFATAAATDSGDAVTSFDFT